METGMYMLMKTFGIDPQAIIKSVEEFKDLVLRLTTAVERVETQNRAIMAHFQIGELNAPGHHGHSGSVDNPGQSGNGVGESRTNGSVGGPAR